MVEETIANHGSKEEEIHIYRDRSRNTETEIGNIGFRDKNTFC